MKAPPPERLAERIPTGIAGMDTLLKGGQLGWPLKPWLESGFIDRRVPLPTRGGVAALRHLFSLRQAELDRTLRRLR